MKREIATMAATVLFAVAAEAVPLHATNTWIGAASDADWFDAANWSLNKAPVHSKDRPFDTMRFTDSATIKITAYMYFNHLFVESGDVVISDPDANVKMLAFEGDGTSFSSSRLDVAEGASLTFTGAKSAVGTYSCIAGGTESIGQRTSLAKYGKGDCTLELQFYDNENYFLETIDVYEGRLFVKLLSTQMITHSRRVHVHDGGELVLGYQKLANDMVVDIDQGGFLYSSGTAATDASVAGVVGQGVVSNMRVYASLAGGPYLFAGRVVGGKNDDGFIRPNQTSKVTDGEFGLIIGATDTLADSKCLFQPKIIREPDSPTNSCLRFAPGVGLFRIRNLNMVSTSAVSGEYLSHPLYLADTDGNAVTVRVYTVTAPVCAGPVTKEGGRGCLLFGKSQTWNGQMGERTDLGAEANITVTLGADAVIDPSATLHLAKGSILDLGGRTVTVSKVVGGGKWRNGQLIRTARNGLSIVFR